MIDFANGRAEQIELATHAERIQVLERVVLDLMMEIEALRAAVMELSSATPNLVDSCSVHDRSPGGVGGEHSVYGRAYLETAWLTHCSAGMSGGWDKLVQRFYSSSSEPAEPMGSWRELIVLQRMGYDPSRIDEYCKSAQAAETYT